MQGLLVMCQGLVPTYMQEDLAIFVCVCGHNEAVYYCTLFTGSLSIPGRRQEQANRVQITTDREQHRRLLGEVLHATIPRKGEVGP